MNSFLIVQGIGAVAFIVGIITYQFNKRKYILSLQTIYNLLYGVQYLLLGSLNSMFMCIIGAVRNIIFSYDEKYSARTRYYILSGFIILVLIITSLNWNSILSVLGCIGTVLSTLAVWTRQEKHIRILSLTSSVVWLIHDIVIGSYAAILDTSLLTVSILIGIYRFDIKNYKQSTTN